MLSSARRSVSTTTRNHPRIARIAVYQVDLPLHEGRYSWSGGKSVDTFDSNIIRVETECGVIGWGENCPLGPAYLPAFAKGTRAGISEIAPSLIGEDPTQLLKLNAKMDSLLRGHPYVKSAMDVACWDILGKMSGLPTAVLLGGQFEDSFMLYRAISQDTPERMAASVQKYRSEGYRKFQLKVGGQPDEDIERIKAAAAVLEKGDVLMADANTGWLMHEAVRVVNAVKDDDVYIEQPCDRYEENLSVRRLCPRPFILDENMDDVGVVLRMLSDRAADVINLKISKVGGLTRARQVRDLCVSMGVALNIEDTWGGDVATAAIAALAHSTPPQLLFASTDFNSYVTVSTAEGAPQRVDGRMASSGAPGLGIQPRMEVLGEPVYDTDELSR